MKIDFDFGPMQQTPITREKIEKMITPGRRRRMKLSLEWLEPLHPPREEGKDWSLVLPFCETLRNAFHSLCSADHIGLREGREDRCYTFFNYLKENSIDFKHIEKCLKTIGFYVAIRDCLAISFAIDFDREGGNPDAPQTRVGQLRSNAKPYGREATQQTYEAADQLAEQCLATLEKLTCYDSATCIVAMPPSDPDKPFDLPEYLAAKTSEALGKADKSDKVKTIKARPGNKELPCGEKLANIEGTVEVDGEVFKDEIVLLIDDLYQSGVTMNYVAMQLLEAGAKKIFGLSCEKTCSNDDNVSRR